MSFLLVGAFRAALSSEAWIYSDARGQLHRNRFHGNMVQDCRAGEDPNSVYPAPAQSPAWDSFRHRSGVVLKVPHCEK